MKELTMEEKIKKVIEEVRPYLQGDGGDVEFVKLTEDNVVVVRLKGACHGCPGAMMTLKMGIERKIREVVPEIKEVIAEDY